VTISSSSVHATALARIGLAAKELTPRLLKRYPVFFNEVEQLRELPSRKAAAASIGYRFKPELRQSAVSLNMDMGGLVILVGIEEKSIRAKK